MEAQIPVAFLQVHGDGVMLVGADTHFVQVFFQFIPSAAADAKNVSDRLCILHHIGQNHLRVLNPFQIHPGNAPAFGVHPLQMGQLCRKTPFSIGTARISYNQYANMHIAFINTAVWREDVPLAEKTGGDGSVLGGD